MNEFSNYNLNKIKIIKLVVCECGHPPIVKYNKLDINGAWDRRYWTAKCSNPYCIRSVYSVSEIEVCGKWNNRCDWYVHELSSVFSEEEYIKMVKNCGGEIILTPYWEKTKHKSCKHCERRERIKESIIKESKIIQVIEKIKKGIDCPKYNPESFIPGLKKETDFIKNEGEWAFGLGWKYAMLHCEELLAKAQNNDK